MRKPSPLLLRSAALLLAQILLGICTTCGQVAPGDLDLSFGTDGTVLTNFLDSSDVGIDVALQADKKIVVVGYAFISDDSFAEDFALARYNPDGTLDATFGTGGKVLTDFEWRIDRAVAVAIQADGKIVVAGRSQDDADYQWALARYQIDGSLDQTFGVGGKVLTVLEGHNARVRAMKIQADQRIVVAGENYNPSDDFTLVRYLSDGTVDKTFGVGGLVVTDFGPSDILKAIAIQPDQKIIAAGFVIGTSYSIFGLARYLPDGTLDPTFGPDGSGKTSNDFFKKGVVLSEIALQPDGAIVVTGYTINEMDGTGDAFDLARYHSDGTVDDSFGTDGAVVTDLGVVQAAAGALAVHPDGAIIVGGYSLQPNTDADFTPVRYTANGSVDENFGTDGKVLTDFSGGYDFIADIIFQPDGKLITAGGGGPNRDFAVTRYITGLPPLSAQSLNISTRSEVGTDQGVLIGGFIVSGSTPKKVLLRAIGPSLPFGNGLVLADPTLELHEPNGTVVTNNDWRESQEQEIIDTDLAPMSNLEAAIVATLDPGGYTVIVKGGNGGTGIGLVEGYDLDQTVDSHLANISTRGFVGTADAVMIGGFILGAGTNDSTVVVRGIGPSLGELGIADPLLNPTLELYDAEGTLLASNDDWKDSQEAELEDSSLAPNDDREAAIESTLPAGAYTTILRGKDGTTGIGLVEVYNLL